MVMPAYTVNGTLSVSETPVYSGTCMLHQGSNIWVRYNATNASNLQGHQIGVTVGRALPGGSLQLITVGQLPFSIFSMPAGAASLIQAAAGSPQRGNSSDVIGNVDAAGSCTLYSSFAGVKLAPTQVSLVATGSGILHCTSGNVDAAASLGSANQALLTNSTGTDTNWITVGGDVTVSGTGATWNLQSISGANTGGGAVPMVGTAHITATAGASSYIDLTAAGAGFGYSNLTALFTNNVDTGPVYTPGATQATTLNIGGTKATKIFLGSTTVTTANVTVSSSGAFTGTVNATNVFSFGAASGDFVYVGPTTTQLQLTKSGIAFPAATSGGGANLSITAQGGSTSNNGGTLQLVSGAQGSGGNCGGITFGLGGTTNTIALQGTGGLGQVLWSAGMTPQFVQTAASGTSGVDWTWQPQFGTASGGNQQGGNAIVNVQNPTGTGNEAYLQVKRNGTKQAQVGSLVGSSGASGALYLGNLTASATNFAASSDGTNLTINTPGSGTLSLGIAGTVFATLTSSGLGGTSGTPLRLQTSTINDPNTLNLVTSLSSAQLATPYLILTGTMNTSWTIQFGSGANGTAGVWFIDVAQFTWASANLTFQAGASGGTLSIASRSTTGTLLTVSCDGAGHIAVNGS